MQTPMLGRTILTLMPCRLQVRRVQGDSEAELRMAATLSTMVIPLLSNLRFEWTSRPNRTPTATVPTKFWIIWRTSSTSRLQSIQPQRVLSPHRRRRASLRRRPSQLAGRAVAYGGISPSKDLKAAKRERGRNQGRVMAKG